MLSLTWKDVLCLLADIGISVAVKVGPVQQARDGLSYSPMDLCGDRSYPTGDLLMQSEFIYMLRSDL